MASNQNSELDQPPGPEPTYQSSILDPSVNVEDPDWAQDYDEPVVYDRSESKIHRANKSWPEPASNCWVEKPADRWKVTDYADIHRHKELCHNRGCWPSGSHDASSAPSGEHKPLPHGDTR